MPKIEIRLLDNNHDVLSLFAGNPFAQRPPRQVRAVIWQYWFTTISEKHQSGRGGAVNTWGFMLQPLNGVMMAQSMLSNGHTWRSREPIDPLSRVSIKSP